MGSGWRTARRRDDQQPAGATGPVRLVHVLTVSQSLPFLGGQPAFTRARGFEAHAIAAPGPHLARFAAQENIPVYGVPMSRRITPVADLVALLRLYRLLRRLRPAIVQAGTPKGGLLGMIAAWLARVPVRIYHNHGLPLMTATGRRRRLLRWSELVACRLAHRVLSVSHSVRVAMIAEGLCPPEKIVVLGTGSCNGVDATDRFNPALVDPAARDRLRASLSIPPTALTLGFVGRLTPDKGVINLVEGWALLAAEVTDLHLLVVGPFEAEQPLPAAVVERLRTDPRIHLTGEVADTAPYYAAMDVLVFPTTDREGLPTVLLEAAAMALPVVATRVLGCVDAVVDGVTGTLVPPRDTAALVAAVRAYLADPALRRRHGQQARERVLREFRPEAIWDGLVQEYERLLRARGLAAPRPIRVAAPGEPARPAGTDAPAA